MEEKRGLEEFAELANSSEEKEKLVEELKKFIGVIVRIPEEYPEGIERGLDIFVKLWPEIKKYLTLEDAFVCIMFLRLKLMSRSDVKSKHAEYLEEEAKKFLQN